MKDSTGMSSPNVRLPPYHKLLWPTLVALDELGGSGTINEIVDKISENEVSPRSSNRSRTVTGKPARLLI